MRSGMAPGSICVTWATTSQSQASDIVRAILAQSLPPQYANALSKAQYMVYTGDVNGDGIVDVLLVPKRVIVMIDYDVPFPVVAKPASPPFVLLSGSGAYALAASPAQSILRSSVWQAGGYALLYGDTLGDGSVNMLLQPLASNRPSFLITTSASTGQPQLLEQLTPSAIGVDLSASGTVASLQDINADGRADLVVYTNGSLSTALVAASDGTFAPPAASAGGPALAAWRALCAALTLGDAASATNLLSSTSQPQYAGALTALGSTSAVTEIPRNWSEPRVVVSTADFAEFTVFQTESGVLKMHYVTILNEAGSWLVESF